MLSGVPFGQRGEKPGFGSFWEVSWVLEAVVCALDLSQLCTGRLWRALLERLVGLCWSPVAPHAVDAGFEKIPPPCCWRWAHQGHTIHLPQHRGGHVTPSCLCPHRCGRGCSTPVNHLLRLCLEPCTLNLLEAWCSKRAMLSSGQRLEAPLDLLFPFPSGAFLPVRCLQSVGEQLAP